MHKSASLSNALQSNHYQNFLIRFAKWGSYLVIFAGITVLIGWALHIRIFITFLPGLVAMKVNTACCFIAAGICLSTLRSPAAQWQLTWLARGLAAGVAIIGGLSFAENVLDQDFGIDQLLLLDNWQSAPTPHPGRMAAVAGANFALIGLALLCLKSHQPRLARCTQWLNAPTLFISLLAIVAYAYGIELPDQMKHYNLMALHTVLTFFILALSIVAVDSDHGFAKIAISDTAGGLVARWLLPAIPLVLIMLGGPTLMGERAGLYAFSFGLALNVALSTTVGVIAISVTAAILHRIDLRRRHIEAELFSLNGNLERRVVERTEQLDAANRSLLRDAAARRNAQEALKDSEARYRLLADGSSDIVARLSLDRVQQYVSPASLEILGFTPDEMVGTRLTDFTHPDELDGLNDTIAALGANGVDQGRNTHRTRHKAGHWVWVDVQFRLVRDKVSGEAAEIVSSMRDVSRREKLQEQIVAVADLLQATLDNMDQGLVKVAADGRIELVNRRFGELMGLEGDSAAQPNMIYADVLGSLADRGDIMRLTSGERLSLPGLLRYSASTFERHRPDGVILEVATVILPDDSMVRTFSDITARRQAEMAVRDSETRYRMLAHATSDMIMQLDLDMRRIYVSPACRLLVGHEPADMLNQVPRDHMHPEDAPEVFAKLQALVSGSADGDTGRTTYRVRHKDGHWVWVDASASLLRDAEGRPQTVITSLRDVTERQRSSRHLERAKAAAENAARQQSEFVANMSHELRTPLTGILGIHDLLQRDPTLGPQQRRYLEMARDAGRSLLSIVNDVLDFSKIEAGQLAIEKVPFRLHGLVEACAELAAEAAKQKGLRFETHTQGGELSVMGDPARLRQILLNLMTNAVKFTDDGGVTIRASYRADASRMRIEVADTGIGIPEDKLPLMFARFSQADASTTRRYGGTGLGLAICKRLVELMGGEIGVNSVVGRGSTFWFDMPLPLAPAESEQPTPATVQAPAPAGYRVLLAEDNVLNQEVIAAMLTQRGHAVTMVDNGAAAAAAAACARPRFDLILMDIQMPVMDGLTATRAIRSAELADGQVALPIIGLTANAMLEDVECCLDAGMVAHVAKPIDWIELFATIERVVSAGRERAMPMLSDGGVQVSVLNAAKLDDLTAVIGRERVARLLGAFVRDVEIRLGTLENAGVGELRAQCHTMVSTAGQFGFAELAQLCAEVEDAARAGGGLDRVGALHAAAARAVAVARSFTCAEAA